MIYHLTQHASWSDAIDSGIYIDESLESEGFIHCSCADQVTRTANAYFSGMKEITLLEIDETELEFELKYEKGSDVDQNFPHIYGPINLDAVTRVTNLTPGHDGLFSFFEFLNEQRFWQTKEMDQLTRDEWESLCDGCARCCLYKIQDIDTNELFYTNVACRYLQGDDCKCSDYIHRHEIMPTCIILTPQNLQEIDWMPDSCAYRLLKENRSLRWWHPLVSGSSATVHQAGISIRGWFLPEEQADMDHLEEYVVEPMNE